MDCDYIYGYQIEFNKEMSSPTQLVSVLNIIMIIVYKIDDEKIYISMKKKNIILQSIANYDIVYNPY